MHAYLCVRRHIKRSFLNCIESRAGQLRCQLVKLWQGISVQGKIWNAVFMARGPVKLVHATSGVRKCIGKTMDVLEAHACLSFITRNILNPNFHNCRGGAMLVDS